MVPIINTDFAPNSKFIIVKMDGLIILRIVKNLTILQKSII